MDYGSGYLTIVLIWFFSSVIWQLLCDPEVWEPVDISKPDIGHTYGSDNNAFVWAMMQNQDE